MPSAFRRPHLPIEIAVFVCGAVGMTFELLGSRVLGPYVGTSIYAWTALIGIILASLSAGYYAGGRIADRHPDVRRLATVIILAALAIAFTALAKDVVAALLVHFDPHMETAAILIALPLFAPASFLLGIVSPYAVKLLVNDLGTNASTVGSLYALSTLGSIIGTFFAGFVLIPHLGTTAALYVTAAALFAVAVLLLAWSRSLRSSFPILVIAAMLAGSALLLTTGSTMAQRRLGLIDRDTPYSRVIVYKGKDAATGRPTLNLATDPFGIEGAIFTDGLDDLVFDYTKFYRNVTAFHPNPTHALMLGGCTYGYPRDFLKQFPEATMDVVEIDPGMTAIAQEYFGLKPDPRLRIIHEDGRIFLNGNAAKYDVIFGDAFNSFSSIPFQLTTLEAVRKMSAALTDDGVMIVNTISAVTGDKGKFLRAEYATFKAVFPEVDVFPLKEPADGDANQNVMLVAFKTRRANPSALPHPWIKPIADDLPILTDDFAPVDDYKRQAL